MAIIAAAEHSGPRTQRLVTVPLVSLGLIVVITNSLAIAVFAAL